MRKSRKLFGKLVKPRRLEKDLVFGGCVVIEEIKEIVAKQGPQPFIFQTLSSATEGFNAENKLGKGGFAHVYKGKLNDGTEIAVKKPLQISDKGKELVLNELKLLLRSAHHRNIVKFLGYCSHGEETLLVFEFASNGSLDDLAFKSETGRAYLLDWKRTYAIIIGVARGLLYLHEGSHSVIIHSDIKPANILIDENWVPKIADFGMACLLPQDQTHVYISKPGGTNGYWAPEYMCRGHLSLKADTYSFGIVVLELISGRKNWNSHDQSPNGQGLRDRAKELCKEGKVSEFMDQKLIPSAILNEVQLCVKIGVLCTKFDPKQRPTMNCVYSMLSENHSSSSSTLVEPMRDGSSSSSSSSTARNLGPTKLANNGSSSGVPKHRQLTRSQRIQPKDVQSYISSIRSSSCSSSGTGIQIEPEEGPVRATIQEAAAAATTISTAVAVEEEDEEGIHIPMITKEDPIETMGKLCPRKTSARQSREKTPLPPAHMTKQTKEALKKVAKQQQTVEEEADKKHRTTLNDTKERPIMPEIKVDKERLAADDAKEDHWQAFTKPKSLETSFNMSLNDEGNKSSWCEAGSFERW